MAALSFASPTRVLDRIKRMEEAELPSLPSIQPNFDNDSVATSEGYTEQGEMDSVACLFIFRAHIYVADKQDATPLPRHQATSANVSSTSSTSSAPFPPLPSRASSSSTTPYYSRRTGTSTPFNRRVISDDHETPSTARYLGHSRNSSDTRYSSPQFHTPGEMSGSFGAEPIPAVPVTCGSDGEEEMDLEHDDERGEGEQEDEMPSLPDAMEYSTPLNDSTSSNGSLPTETPLRRFSRNVVVDRPGRKSQSLIPNAAIPSPASQSPMSLPQPTPGQRVPSLTSEVSTDTSHAATTPEAPPRHAPVATPSFSRSLHEEHSLEIIEHPTPAPSTVYTTPGLMREPAQAPTDESVYRLEGLSDMTDRFRRSLNTPFTPSPLAKGADLATPRAPLNDSERRKSHVLAVLQSTQPRQRTPYPRGQNTPGTPFSATPRALDRSSSAPNESILSIASSADLTTDRRAVTHSRVSISRGNTSFPNMLLGNTSVASHASPATTDRRADGVKIQKHLNAMNRQLLETNADLAREAEGWKEEAGRLKGLLKDAGVKVDDVDVSFVAKSRDNSYTDDSRVEQDSAQRMVASYSPEQSAAIMQKLAEEMEDLQDMLNQKDEQIVALQDELSAQRDQGAPQNHQAELLVVQQRLERAEEERANLHASFASQTAEHARQFAEISAAFEQQAQELQVKLTEAEDEISQLREEREQASARDGAGEGEGDSERAAEVEQQIRDLQDEVDARGQELEELEAKYAESADLAADLETRLQDAEVHARQGDERDQEYAAQIADLEAQIQTLQTDLDAHAADVETLQSTIDTLNATIEERDSEITSLEGRLEVAELAAQPLRQSIASASASASASARDGDNEITNDAQASFVAAMEERLDEAYREIGRLKHELTASPQRKATMDAKDARIAALEREKATLLARQKAVTTPLRLATSNSAGIGGSHGTGTGNWTGNGSPLGKNGRPRPLFNKALQHLQTPRTPGSMKELSWLNSTVGDANEPILRAQVDYLQTELEKVNGQLDSNFSRLEEAGLGSVALAEKLAAALAKIGELEDEIRALLIKDKTGMLDAQQATGDKERLQNALAEVHEQLDSLRLDSGRERTRLAADIADLKKALNEQIDTTEREVERMRLETIDALDAAHGNVEKAKEDAIASTRETATVRAELQAVQRQVRTLERDLERARKEHEGLRRRHADSVPLWETQSKEGTIKRLEADLQAVRAEAVDTASRLEQYTSKAKADVASARSDADRLSRQLAQQTSAAQAALEEVHTLKAERARVMREIAAFDADLAIQTAEAKRLKEQLLVLRDNQERTTSEAEGAAKEVQRVRKELEAVLKERMREVGEMKEGKEAREEVERVKGMLQRAREEVEGLERWKEGHECGGDTQSALEDQRARFKASTRDLAAQIRYLKAKYTRESTFRNGLGLQKRYLLLLVGGMSLTEQATLKAIAQMGYPVPEPPRRQRTLKAVGIAVLSVIRARNAAASWKVEKEAKERAVASFTERRR